MAAVISIVNIKGGTGKTTTTYNLGAALSTHGKSILLIDNDSQASLTKAMGFSPADCKMTLAKYVFVHSQAAPTASGIVIPQFAFFSGACQLSSNIYIGDVNIFASPFEFPTFRFEIIV